MRRVLVLRTRSKVLSGASAARALPAPNRVSTGTAKGAANAPARTRRRARPRGGTAVEAASVRRCSYMRTSLLTAVSFSAPYARTVPIVQQRDFNTRADTPNIG